MVLALSLAAGLAAGITEVKGLRPLGAEERRNGILGWGFVVSLILTGVCFALPMPWGALAAIATAAACWALVRSLAGPAPPSRD